MKNITLQNSKLSIKKMRDSFEEKINKKNSDDMTSEIWVHAKSIGEK